MDASAGAARGVVAGGADRVVLCATGAAWPKRRRPRPRAPAESSSRAGWSRSCSVKARTASEYTHRHK